MAAEHDNKLLILPIIFYSPETELAFGIYPSYLFRVGPLCRPSSVSMPAYYTTNKQFAVYLEWGITLPENRHNFSGELYMEKWPDVFYGIGEDSSPYDTEDYTSRNAGINLGYKKLIKNSLYLGANLSLHNRKYLEYPDGGRLTTGEISGSEDGRQTGFGLSVTWDDRDNILYPGDGYFGEVSVGFNGNELGGNYRFKSYSADLRKYMTIRATDAFSMQAAAVYLDGGPPFWAMPRVGDYLRGFKPMRFIDKNLLSFRLEYRIHPIWKRFGLSLFAGAAAVESRMPNMDLDDFHPAAGFGIRYLFIPDEKLNIRLDFGIGAESTEIYLEAGEAF